MTKEELLELINSTITTNGNGDITGDNLNYILNSILGLIQ